MLVSVTVLIPFMVILSAVVVSDEVAFSQFGIGAGLSLLLQRTAASSILQPEEQTSV